MKEERIRDVLTKNHMEFAEHATICGTIKASVAAYYNGLGRIMYTMKDHVLNFNDQGIGIVAIDDTKGSLREETFVCIPQEKIRSVIIKMRLFTFALLIQTDEGEIRYKIRRSVLGTPWHKENLSYILLRLV